MVGSWASLVRLIVQRARAAPALVGLRLLGIVVAVALVCAVSLYSGAMADVMLQATLSPHGDDVTVGVTSSPGRPDGMPYPTLRLMDSYLRGAAAADLGLPVRGVSAHFQLPNPWQLTAWGQSGAVGSTSYGGGFIEYLGGIAAHARVLRGAFVGADRLANGSIPVAVSRAAAESSGLAVGQRLALLVPDLSPGQRIPPLQVTAIYTPTSATDPYWQASSPPINSSSLGLISQRAFNDLSMLATSTTPEYAWQVAIRPSAIHFGAASEIEAALPRFTTLVPRMAPGTTTFATLAGALKSFAGTFALLNILLYLLAAPVVLIILYYLTVSTELVLDHQAGEIVLMRSRGAAARQILGIQAVESVLLGLIAIVLGPFLALPVAAKIGQTSGFLQFGNGASRAVGLSPPTFATGAVVAAIAVVAGLIPALAAARRTMSGQKQQQARGRYRPLWQQLYLDALLMAVALYGYWVLTKQGAIAPSQNQSALSRDPFVVLTPGLFVLAGTLLLGRLLPLISAATALMLRRGSVPLSMAVQTIARTPRQYVRLVMLLSLTLSIGVFAAAVAGTIGSNLDDQYRYQAGASLRLVEDYPKINQLLALPSEWHMRQQGVRAVSPVLRVESYQADAASGDFSSPIEVLGIDPSSFGRVAWFRRDFATQSLPALLGLLGSATQPRMVINDALINATKAHVGDQIQLSVGGAPPVLVTVAGVVHYFPTLNPPEGYYAIVNMAYLRALSSAPGPSEMWMATDGSAATANRVIAAVQGTGRVVVDYEAQAPPINIVDNPLQVGIYGVTSIGFIIAAGLAMLGLVAYLYLSMERRAGDFGVLRALGSSTAQVAAMLLLEQLFLVAIGVVAALVIGLLGGQLFIPYLPIAQFTTPPFLVDVPWQDVVRLVVILLAAFAVALAASAYAITRVQIGRILRLGEA